MKTMLVATAVYGLDGGLERFNRRFVRSLAELRGTGLVDHVSVLSHWDTRRSASGAPEGVRFRAGNSSILGTLIQFIFMALLQRPDVIFFGHVVFAPLMPLGLLLSPRSKRVLLVHGVEVWRSPGRLRGWSVRRFAHTIFAVSAFTVGKMSASFGVESKRFRVLPNAIDVVDGDSEVRTSAASTFAGRFRLLSVTRLSLVDQYKNVDKVILALPKILAAYPDTHYYVVGDGSWLPDLRMLAEETGVAGNVHFLGLVGDRERNAAYASSHIFVLPSTGEGFGIVFLEAWMFGLPAIASDQDAACEVIRHGVDGLCVDPRPDPIAEAVCALLAEPERRRAMGTAGRRRLEERFTHASFVGNLSDLLAEVASCAG